MSELLNYRAIKTSSLIRETEEQKLNQRKKSLLLLVLHYLKLEGYFESTRTLERETNLNLDQYEICDNIDLETILMDFESFYHIKFNKYPKIIKKLHQLKTPPKRELKSCPVKDSNHRQRIPQSDQNPKLSGILNFPKISPKVTEEEEINVSLVGIPVRSKTTINQNNNIKQPNNNNNNNNNNFNNLNNNNNDYNNFNIIKKNEQNSKSQTKQIIDFKQMIHEQIHYNIDSSCAEDKLLRPLGGFQGYSSEWKELAQVVSRDIFLENPNVKWNDIIGLEDAKLIIKESVVYPIKFPQFFKGLLSPWKGLLLYGPPGTGKTLLAKALATECKTTLFNISASTLVSKWRGDSEKLVRVLFELARFHAPSTIFLDEIDALMSQRGGQDHEGSRRMKTEILMQMDGLAKTDELVFLLAASNLPWQLDHALLRRLEKRIMVGLPNEKAREAMFKHYLPQFPSTGLPLKADLDYRKLGEESGGYSGSDIHLVCKEAAMKPLRKVFEVLERLDEGGEEEIKEQIVDTGDVVWALNKIKPTANFLMKKYLEWQKNYEAG